MSDKVLTPQQFGAACDGVTDDTEALQKAINAAAEEGEDDDGPDIR